jgi:hypothetical protein
LVRHLRRLLLILRWSLLPDIRETAPEFGIEIGIVGRNLNWFTSFMSQPAVQFFRGSLYAPTLVGNWHPGFCPSLSHRCWLTQEGGDLLPAIQ